MEWDRERIKGKGMEGKISSKYITCLYGFSNKTKELLNEFQLRISTEIPTITEIAPNVLLLFCATHLHEAAFSALRVMKKVLIYSEEC